MSENETQNSVTPQTTEPRNDPPRSKMVPVFLAGAVAIIGAAGFQMFRHAQAKTNNVALASDPKPVSAVVAKPSTYRATRRYVATIDPWLQAKVGPQLVSAYVDTVLFRPGATVKKGEVLATLDCRNASTEAQAVAMAARALEAKQAALAKEAARLNSMLDGGFVSQNEADKKQAEAATQSAEILSAKAKLAGSSLEVNDCILKAPFDGDVDARMVDPGAFVKPGTSILSLVDRGTVRIAADVPETDWAVVAPTTSVAIKLLATGRVITAPIARRTPAADLVTRTVHVEIDVADPLRDIPVGTTAEVAVDVGDPVPAVEVPLIAALVRGDKATLFLVEGGVAKKKTVAVIGERGGSLFLDPSLAGAHIVTEGRSLLADGDRVTAKDVAFVSAETKPGETKSGESKK